MLGMNRNLRKLGNWWHSGCTTPKADIYLVQQFPVCSLEIFSETCRWSDGTQTLWQWSVQRILELTFTAWDLEAFGQDCGYKGPPFVCDEARRFVLRCELDAAFFHLYLGGQVEWQEASRELFDALPTPRHAVDYIMDTFPIVKRQDEQQHGEYRTKRVILEIYDAMQKAIDTGQPYQTLLDPPPGPPPEGLPDWQPGQPKPATWPAHIHPPRHASGTATTESTAPQSLPNPAAPSPWQMTRGQYQEHCQGQGRNDVTENNRHYYREVEAAIQADKPVPQKVRAEYEQLKAKK